MKVALVGPTWPFRGGIAHYTTLLYKNLAKIHDVRLYTYERTYPRILYPGNASPDQSRMRLLADNPYRTIDWLNPLSWLETGILIARWSPHAIIFSWWMWGWAIPVRLIAKIATRRKNCTMVIFICHNVIEHESAPWKSVFTKFALACAEHYVVHSTADFKTLRDVFPKSKVHVIFHPTYASFRRKSLSKREARCMLHFRKSVKRIILYFGIVRPYKGLQYLIEAMQRIVREQSDIHLLIVGEFWDDTAKYAKQISELQLKDNIEIIDRYIPNEDIEKYIAAADVVILPYVSGTGSGVVQVAYGCNKPVIATKVGCLPEVVDDGKTGLLVEPMDSAGLADAVLSFYRQKMGRKMINNIMLNKNKFSWSKMVSAIEDITQRTCEWE